MQIEVSNATEGIIRQQLAQGAFSSPSEVVEAMAVHWMRTRGETASLCEDIDIDALAAAQQVGPIINVDDLVADFWPIEEPDEFVHEIRQLRQQGAPRELP